MIQRMTVCLWQSSACATSQTS
ncbi:hypothetical protein RB2654_14335 [Rhodobacterales bacterium HTCC2654]|uniref:Uncharacterized protein n=1 Tax=Maritimibacter alkaliphilus HTCC2654 TaxID=314271 RepID=A3VGR6_9RHOB|nr:hypothetical protein RB2654_14335 [Rhodobacterales bacterium HTCC2654] [Maritimibacter alkaliphilus HTCC2654]